MPRLVLPWPAPSCHSSRPDSLQETVWRDREDCMSRDRGLSGSACEGLRASSKGVSGLVALGPVLGLSGELGTGLAVEMRPRYNHPLRPGAGYLGPPPVPAAGTVPHTADVTSGCCAQDLLTPLARRLCRLARRPPRDKRAGAGDWQIRGLRWPDPPGCEDLGRL